MEKDQFIALINNFDEFVKLELERKTNKQIKLPLQSNTNVQNYRIGMEKRLKLKPPSQEEKFNKILAPMKNLKSFVSVKEFMQKLGTNKFLSPSKNKKVKQHSQIKERYEGIRGGYYIKKVQQHLKNKKFKRQTVTPFLTEIEEDPLNPSQFKTWMEQTLVKINPRPEQMFKSFVQIQSCQKLSMQDVLLQEHKTQYKQQFKVINNIHQQSSKQYQQFSKISSLLTHRLRKLLRSNCGKTSKIDFITESASQSSQKKSYTQRFSANSRPTMPVSKKNKWSRIETASSAKKEDLLWKENVNNKFRNIILTDNQQQFQKND